MCDGNYGEDLQQRLIAKGILTLVLKLKRYIKQFFYALDSNLVTRVMLLGYC